MRENFITVFMTEDLNISFFQRGQKLEVFFSPGTIFWTFLQWEGAPLGLREELFVIKDKADKGRETNV